MRPTLIGGTALAILALAAPAAEASVAHTVQPGETLWSIAAASNLTTRTLAAANGLPETASVVAGRTLQIPSVAEGTAALSRNGGAVAPASGATASTASSSGGYTVRPGDTLSGIASRNGVSLSALAAANGLTTSSPVIIGHTLTIPSGSQAAATTAPAPTSSSGGAVAPQSSTRVGASQIGAIASQNGVSSSLASAIAWQESGFNNGAVSSAGARGTMQVMPGTWDWVQQNLAGRQLDPSSASDNVHAGTLYLNHLLRESGGDPATAIAGYYQGAASVRRIGMLPETQRYVASVMALRSRFGGQ